MVVRLFGWLAYLMLPKKNVLIRILTINPEKEMSINGVEVMF